MDETEKRLYNGESDRFEYLKKDVEEKTTYHKPTDKAIILHTMVRKEIFNTMLMFQVRLPSCREKHIATQKLEEAMFWANASITRRISAKED